MRLKVSPADVSVRPFPSGKLYVLALDETRVLIRPMLCFTAGCNLNVHALVSPDAAYG